jgi:hypothetical protein
MQYLISMLQRLKRESDMATQLAKYIYVPPASFLSSRLTYQSGSEFLHPDFNCRMFSFLGNFSPGALNEKIEVSKVQSFGSATCMPPYI